MLRKAYKVFRRKILGRQSDNIKMPVSSVENVSGGWSHFCLKVFDTLQTKDLPPSIKSFRIIHTKHPLPPGTLEPLLNRGVFKAW